MNSSPSTGSVMGRCPGKCQRPHAVVAVVKWVHPVATDLNDNIAAQLSIASYVVIMQDCRLPPSAIIHISKGIWLVVVLLALLWPAHQPADHWLC